MTLHSLKHLVGMSVVTGALVMTAGCDNLEDILKDALKDRGGGGTGGKAGPGAPGDDCKPMVRADGSMCRVCFDPSGKVTVQTCDVPPPPPECPPKGMPAQPDVVASCGAPVPPAKCAIEKLPDGTDCMICYDPTTGSPISRACGGAIMPPPPPPLQCKVETLAEGVVCKVCYDASGTAVTRACGGETMPPPPPLQCKAEMLAEGVVCKVCYDATGTVVARDCN